MLEILFQDQYLVAINKPHGMVVHRSEYTRDARVFALQELRNQLNRKVFPAHRLDRKTSGVLTFAFDHEALRDLQIKFEQRKVKKEYLAIVRGYTEDRGFVDKPFTKENGNLQEAYTEYSTIGRCELDFPSGPHQTSRYSLVKIMPLTGRMNQIRRHFSHINHPIIGDRPFGCNKQNKLFKQKYGITFMFLHASKIEFTHPVTEKNVLIEAPLQKVFSDSLKIFNWQYRLTDYFLHLYTK